MRTFSPSLYCCRQPTMNPRPFPPTDNLPEAEFTRLYAARLCPTILTVGSTRLGGRAASREMCRHIFPSFADYTHIYFLHHLLLLLLLLRSRSAHGHAAQLRMPPAASCTEGARSYTPTSGLQLPLYFPPSAGISPSQGAATPSPSESCLL